MGRLTRRQSSQARTRQMVIDTVEMKHQGQNTFSTTHSPYLSRTVNRKAGTMSASSATLMPPGLEVPRLDAYQCHQEQHGVANGTDECHVDAQEPAVGAELCDGATAAPGAGQGTRAPGLPQVEVRRHEGVDERQQRDGHAVPHAHPTTRLRSRFGT